MVLSNWIWLIIGMGLGCILGVILGVIVADTYWKQSDKTRDPYYHFTKQFKEAPYEIEKGD